eukprot:CAMPEP_0201592336 /NCGR_PEP_ID=MMETSP0190_2-20130828/190258_1 /ASSEMBLY_ACC=CAM_ASM_000263 /TAXON_ID=37353 /ORGANISM="Rosalina sp." /LENGTH=766 /DNA_ID=CAMNT_0048051059 /DNA_START=781 /DNA_END=3081 /DNA_ORIENTATION=-
MIDMTAALKSWIEKGQYNFKEHCRHQQQYYVAIAHYYESQRVAKLAEEGVYGKEIAWLKSANSILSSIANSKSKLIPTLTSHRKQLIRKLSPRLKEALKDNNDIYHDPVPSISSMKSIDGRQNVAIIEYKPKTDNVEDPFKNMVPKDTAKKADQLKAELMGEIQSLNLKVNENNDNARAILASLGLPAAVDCAQTTTGLPDAVWERVAECKKIGGVKELNTMYSRIESINQESWKILQEEVIKTLDVEQSIDTQIRTKLGSKWQRTDSMQLQKEYRQQVDVIANHLTTAIETNSKIEKSMKENGTQMSAFDKSKEELADELPNVDEIKDNEEAEQLKVFLDELSEVIAKRDTLKQEYEKEVNNLDLAQLFMQNQTASVDTIKNLAKTSLNELTKQVDAGIKEQQEILEKISTQNELFVASKQNDPKQTQREQMIHVLNENNLDLAQLFMQNQTASVDTIKNLAKTSLNELTKQVDAGIKEQQEILEKISTQNELFVASKQNDPKQTQREQMIHVLNETCVKFKDNERHLKEGLKFYSDLMADYILPLKDEIDNYCAARESERDLLLADLGQNIAKLGIDTNATSASSAASSAPQQPQKMEVEQKQQPPATNPAAQQQPASNPAAAQPTAPQYAQPPAQGYNPYYSQQPPPQQYAQQPQYAQPQQPNSPPAQQQQPPPQGQPQYAQPPPQGYAYPPQYAQQPPPQGYYQQPPPQYAQQPPPQGYYQQPPPQGYAYPPQYAQQPPPQGYNPAYQPPANNNNQPSAPPQ